MGGVAGRTGVESEGVEQSILIVVCRQLLDHDIIEQDELASGVV
jgi:hypothetical protein